MNDPTQANCSHLNVKYDPVQEGQYMRERWVCTTSGCEFIPVSLAAAQARDNESLRGEVERLKASALELGGDLYAQVCEVSRLERELAEAKGKQCHHGWRGSVPEEGQVISTRCPSCDNRSLFIGKGGHLTCSILKGCADPGVDSVIESLRTRADLAEGGLASAMQERDLAVSRVEVAEGLIRYAAEMLDTAIDGVTDCGAHSDILEVLHRLNEFPHPTSTEASAAEPEAPEEADATGGDEVKSS